jgi:Na+/H+-dicarboxylate symporter
MFRSATNVLGNALATSVVGQWKVTMKMEMKFASVIIIESIL